MGDCIENPEILEITVFLEFQNSQNSRISEFFLRLRTVSRDLLGGVEYTEEIQEMEEIAVENVEDVEEVRDSSHKDLPSLPLTLYHQL